MKGHKYVARLLIRKSGRFLKISILLFAFSLILISIFLTLFLNQYLQIQKDFLENANTHMIETNFLVDETYVAHMLTFSDLAAITKKLNHDLPNVSFKGIYGYAFLPAEDEDGNWTTLYALDDAGAKFLNKNNFQMNTLYSTTLKGDVTTLKIPEIEIDEGGYSCKETIDMTFTNDTIIPEKTPFALFDNASSQCLYRTGYV